MSGPSHEYAANISPNGRYFAYQSMESGGRFAVYVRPYPDASKGPWQISTEGGTAPVWARSGRELFYLDESNTLMAVPVDTSGPEFSPGKPAKVFPEHEVLGQLLLVRCDERRPVPDAEGEQRRRSEPGQYCCRPQLVRGAETACAGSIET